MSRDDLAPVIDESVVSLARKVHREAVATLIAVSRDSGAPASSRAMAATKLLEIGYGRPSQAQPIRVADLESMSDDLRMQLLEALVDHYTPNGFKLLMKASVDEALARQAALPRPNRFQRGPRAQAAPATLPPTLAPPATIVRASSSAKLGGEAYAAAAPLDLSANSPVNRAAGDQAEPRLNDVINVIRRDSAVDRRSAATA